MDIEKNDVDLTKLFRWEGEVPIVNQHNKEVGSVHMRLVGDKSINRARVYGLRESADLREKLKDKKSTEHKAYILELETADRERLSAGVKLLMLIELSGDARRNVLVKLPSEPDSDAPLEEHEEYQKIIDEFPLKFGDLVEKELEKLLGIEEKRIDKLSDEELYKEYSELTIDFLCQEEMNRAFLDMNVFLGTYKDAKHRKRLFRSFDDFEEAAPELKDQLREGYKNIELGMSELKKLQGATQSPPSGQSQKETGE